MTTTGLLRCRFRSGVVTPMGGWLSAEASTRISFSTAWLCSRIFTRIRKAASRHALVGLVPVVSSPRFPSGPVLGGGVGYDFWVGSEVSKGAMARLIYAPLHDYERHTTDHISEPALLYTVTYH